MRLYVYGVTTPEAAVPAGLTGVGGASALVRMVPAGLVAAVVSDAPGLVRARRRDVMAHQHVQAEVGRTAPLLPARFGTIAQDEQDLRSTLEAETDANLATLERVRDRAEMNLKISAANTGVPRLLRESSKLRRLYEETRRRPGYTANVRLGKAVAEGLRQQAAAAAEEVLQQVSELAEEVAYGPEGEGCVANASFLVASDRIEPLSRLVAELASEVGSRAELCLTGPLPCYSFCAQPAPAAAV